MDDKQDLKKKIEKKKQCQSAARFNSQSMKMY